MTFYVLERLDSHYCPLIGGKFKIYRIETDPSGFEHVEPFANTGGANLGLKLLPNGSLLACNSPAGLLSINDQGKVECLTSKSDDGSVINFPDDLDVDSQGKVYFSMASSKYTGLRDSGYKRDFLECRPNGSLYSYDPATHSTKLLIDKLYFANGVALSAKEDFVLVAESSHYQITRYWLRGPQAGKSDLFAGNLPGPPDGITRDDNGDFWVAFPSVRTPRIDYLQHAPMLKNILAYLPIPTWGTLPKYGLIVRINNNGQIVESLHDRTHKVWCVTNVVPWKDYLFLGTLDGDAIARLERPLLLTN